MNLPAADKWLSPGYQSIEADEVALLTTPDAGALIRVIAGDVGGHAGPGSTHTPITLAHATVHPGAQLALPWDPSFNALVYVLAGRGVVGPDAHRRPHRPAGRLRRRRHRSSPRPTATQDGNAPDLELLILGGRPIGSRSPPTARSS